LLHGHIKGISAGLNMNFGLNGGLKMSLREGMAVGP
jgi:hypothetical protein